MSNKGKNDGSGFWEKMLGPSKDDVWRELSTQINAKIETDGFHGFDKMMLDVGNWTITLDTKPVHTGKSTHYYTRMRAPFKANSGFWFNITNQNIFSILGLKLIGGRDIQIHDTEFDKRFIIESNSEWKMRELLSSEKIRTLLLLQQDDIQLSLKNDDGWFGTQFPEGVDELFLLKVGIVTDVRVLRSYFDLFAETLKKMNQIGEASKDNPGVRL